MTTELAKKAQLAAASDMNADLKKVYQTIEKEVKKLASHNIMARYRIGKLVIAVTDNERKYGEAAVPSLAMALGGQVSDTMLWEFRRLANTFTERNLETLLGRTTSGGKCITYNHLRLLANLKPDVRKDMVRKVFVEDLTTDQLAAAIQATTGGKQSRGGRRPNLPKTINAGLSQMGKLSGDIHKRLPLWEKAVFDKCVKGPADKIDDTTLKAIEATQKEITTMISDGQKMLVALEKSEARVKSVIATRKKSGGEGTEAAAAPKRSTKKKTAVKRSGSAADKIKAAKAKKRVKRPQPA